MATNLFSLPSEVRRQIYSYVFADSYSTLAFTTASSTRPVVADPGEVSQKPSTPQMLSEGHTELLRCSKQSYLDSISSYHDARTLRIRNLNQETLHQFCAMTRTCNTARTIVLDGLMATDFSAWPSFPRLQHLTIENINVWGGNIRIERGQKPLEVFEDAMMLQSLLEYPKYQSLVVEDGYSTFFPGVTVTINFSIGYGVLDKNVMRGVQDWFWNCVYHVRTGVLEKKISHRLCLW